MCVCVCVHAKLCIAIYVSHFKPESCNVACVFTIGCSPLIQHFRHAVIRWCWDGIPEERPSFTVLADDIRNLVPENCATV